MAAAAKKQVSLDKKQDTQKKQLQELRKREHWMKWLIIGLIALVLLLILFLGYATDWTKGLRKDSDSLDTSQDSAQLPDANATVGTNNGSNGSTGSNGSNGSNTSRETTNNTTNNTTTTNTTTTPAPAESSSLVLDLYADTSVGDNISDLLSRAQLLGVSQECHNEVLIQVCEFGDGENAITVKSLLGTGLITSIVRDL